MFRALRALSAGMGGYARDYITLLKLQTIEQLARMATSIFSTALLCLGGGFFLFFITFALGFLLANLLHSYALGFLIVAGLWVVIVVVFYRLRHAIFTDRMVRSLIARFFPGEDQETDEPLVPEQSHDAQGANGGG